MSDILVIHHSLDVSSARLLAKALTRLGFDAPTLCDERAHGAFEPALAGGRVAIAIWSGAASGSAGFSGLAIIADAAGKLLSLRGPDGQPPASFGRAFMLAGWDGSDLKHPGLVELARTLTGRFKARRGREAPRIAPISTFGGEPPLSPGPASARMRPRPAPAAPSLARAAQLAVREAGDIAVLAPPRPAIAAPAQPSVRPAPAFEIDPSRIIRRAPMPRARPKRRRRVSWASIVAAGAALGALFGLIGAVTVGEMAFATNTSAPRAALSAPAPIITQAIESEAALMEAVTLIDAPAPMPELRMRISELALSDGDAEMLRTLDTIGRAPVAWRVVARQYVE